MKRRSSYLVGSVIGAALVILFFVAEGLYPILAVEGQFVSAKRFWKNSRAASAYYATAVKAYEQLAPLYKQPVAINKDLTAREIQLSVLEQLIENVLVRTEAEREVGNDLPALVEGKLERYRNDSDLKDAVMNLYGLGFEEFESEILAPQAEREILAGRLFLKGQKLEDWLPGAKKRARVVVFSSRFRWEDGALERVR